MPSPEGIDAELWIILKQALMDGLLENARSASTPPLGNSNLINDLRYINGGTQISWTYRNTGDYDGNGEVNINDLTPIGVHFGKTGNSPDWQQARVADGDGNGEVNLADVTPIGINFLSQINIYEVLTSDSLDDGYQVAGNVGMQSRSAEFPWTFTVDLPPAALQYLRVRPVDSSGIPGELSNEAGSGGGTSEPIEQFEGDSALPLNDNLPLVIMDWLDEEELITVPGGMDVAGNRIGLIFSDGVSIGDANGLVKGLDALIIGSDPSCSLVVLELPTGDMESLEAALDEVRGSGLVEAACADPARVEFRELPGYGESSLSLRYGTKFPNIKHGDSYSWGLENMRAPMSWNLRDHALRQPTQIDYFMLDVFHTNYRIKKEMEGRLKLLNELSESSLHGVAVSFYLNGLYGNDYNVDPINPVPADVYGIDFDTETVSGGLTKQASWLKFLQIIMNDGLKDHPNVRVVNMSFGLPKGTASLSNKVWIDPVGDIYQQAGQAFSQKVRSNWLVCSAAGYEGDTTGALLPNDSAANNAAVRYPSDHWITVEMLTDIDSYDFAVLATNLGGTVSAPGKDTPATGTSFATPQVGSLLSLLWKLQPDLSWQEARLLATGAKYTVPTTGGTKPRIDCYKAVMGIDFLRSGKQIQKAMVDVSDGTWDGQLRVEPFSQEIIGYMGTEDGLRGDGRVTMRDLRAWRDAFLQLQQGTALETDGLDGGEQHFKKDLNINNVLNGAAASPRQPYDYEWKEPTAYDLDCGSENVYPRYDFNGDGVLDFTQRDVGGQMKTDLDLLADSQIWQQAELNGYNEHVSAHPGDDGQDSGNPELWQPETYLLTNRDESSQAPELLRNTPDYLHSVDIHFFIDWTAIVAGNDHLELYVESEVWPDGIDNNGVNGIDEGYEQSFRRSISIERPDLGPPVVTLPVYNGRLKYEWYTHNGDHEASQQGSLELDDAEFGQDIAVRIPSERSWHMVEVAEDLSVHGLIEIQGSPALFMGSLGGAEREMFYRMADDNLGSSWGTPIETNIMYDLFTRFSVADVNSAPAVASLNFDSTGNDYTLRYTRALDASGSSWPAAKDLASGEYLEGDDGGGFGYQVSMENVDGQPGIAYMWIEYSGFYDGHPLHDNGAVLRYVRSVDATGEVWPTPHVDVNVETYDNGGPFFDTAKLFYSDGSRMEKGLGVFYMTKDGLSYQHAQGGLGLGWDPPILVDELSGKLYNHQFAVSEALDTMVLIYSPYGFVSGGSLVYKKSGLTGSGFSSMLPQTIVQLDELDSINSLGVAATGARPSLAYGRTSLSIPSANSFWVDSDDPTVQGWLHDDKVEIPGTKNFREFRAIGGKPAVAFSESGKVWFGIYY